MYVLGINGSTLRDGIFRRFGGMHNSAACILRDGELLAFVEEERFTHVKQFGGFPYHSIRYCLEVAGIGLGDVDRVAYGWKSPSGIVAERLATYLRNGMFFRTNYPLGVLVIDMLEVLAGGLRRSLRRNFGAPVPPITFVEHHRSHAASSFRCSGFEEATILNLDGAGETTATYLGRGRGDSIERLAELKVPNSLGKVYYLFTQYLGFRPNNDEYKVMGLASYGTPRFDMSGILRQVDGSYRVDPRLFYRYSLRRRRFDVSGLVERFGEARVDDDAELVERHKDVAASLQHRLEEVALDLVARGVERTGSRNLCLAGGVALNCKMNGEILHSGLVDRVFVQPAANDAGVALGAALEVAALAGAKPAGRLPHVYWGPAYGEREVEDALRRRGLRYTRHENIEEVTAQKLAAGDIVGWFQGRMEVGPRALGNRSILADPRVPGMDDKVNQEIKFREKWRPFCPSLLDEARDRYLEDASETPFMNLVFRIRKERRDEIPAVVHVDGTARPQTVTREANPRYWRLLERFECETGTPVLLNTSFNVKGDTIVRTPDDAIETFLVTGMDHLAIGNFLASK